MKSFTTSLLITTYNSPDLLDLCLRSVATLSEMPDEILIADDGSGEPTAEVVRHYAATLPVKVKHVWQEDKGFRAGASRNKAIAASECDYIIQIDGDIVMHPDFIADHKRFARRGAFVAGSRKLLTKEATDALKRNPDLKRLFKAAPLRCYALTLLFRNLRASDGTYARSCNMAAWRDDLMAVNGYNEEISGWGREDSELSWRLMNFGLKKRFLKFGAIEFHLYHHENSREMDARNFAIMERARTQGVTRVPCGIVKE